MACDLIGGISLSCRDGVGGILEVKVKVHPGTATIDADFTDSSGTVTIAAGASRSSWYTYNLEKETANFSWKQPVSQANGTQFWEQTLKMVFNKLSAQINNEMKVLGQNRLLFAIKDMNDVVWLMGMRYGSDMTETTGNSGTARGDRSGYECTFMAKEKDPPFVLSEATYDTLVT